MSAVPPSSDAEPVDAEFEPAPGDEDPAPPAAKPKRGPGWLGVLGFGLMAAVIGGGTGWLMGRYLPPGDVNAGDLEARLAALESATTGEDALLALQARIEAVELLTNGQDLRVEAFEQLVRDVAGLRDRLTELEARPGASDASAPQGLAELEARLNAAFSEIERRLAAFDTDLAVALDTAETAQAAVQQALTTGTPTGAEPTAPVQNDARITRLIRQLTTLESSVDTLRRQVSALETGGPDLAAIQARLDEVEAELAALGSAGARTAEAETTEGAARQLAARSLAFAALSEAAAGSAPFPMEYAELAVRWPGAPGLETLAELARTGAPTRRDLADTFPGEALRAATGETQVYFGVLRVGRETETASAAGAIESALETGDLQAAIRAAGALDSEAGETVSDWLRAARSRQSLDAQIDAVRSALARAGQGDAP